VTVRGLGDLKWVEHESLKRLGPNPFMEHNVKIKEVSHISKYKFLKMNILKIIDILYL